MIWTRMVIRRLGGTRRAAAGVHHARWWDPWGWLGGGAPKPRALADAAQGVPHRGRVPRQAPMPSAHRVGELTGRRTEYSRSWQLSDGRVQADISAVPLNYRDALGRWQSIDTTVSRTARPGFSYGGGPSSTGFLPAVAAAMSAAVAALLRARGSPEETRCSRAMIKAY